MKLRYYTSNDYINEVPCVFWNGKADTTPETVRVLGASGAHPFDGSRQLTIKFSNGHVRTVPVDGSDLKCVVWAMCK